MKVRARLGIALGIGCALFLLGAGCEDDPHDLDFTKMRDAATDAGSDAGAGDAATQEDGGATDSGGPDSGAAGSGSDAGGDDAGDAN